MSKVIKSNIFFNKIRYTQKDKSRFFETCVLEKQHKIYNKKPATKQATKAGVYLYTILFEGVDTLHNINGNQYKKIVIDNAIYMRFFMTLKRKNAIYNDFIIIFN